MHLNKRNKSQHGNTVLTSQYIEKKASLKHEHLIYFNLWNFVINLLTILQWNRTCAGIAGKDFVILSGDTRLSASSMVVMSRTAPKVYRLTPKVYMTGTGFQGDMIQLVKVLRTRIQQYLFTFNEYMDIHAAAQLLSRTLYFRRFFPYYVGAIIGGIDRDGRGVLYSYDPVGTIEELPYSAQGEGSYLIEPFFDNQIGWKTQPEQTKQPLSKERAQQLMHDAFISTIEREKSTGDAVQMVVLHGDRVEEHILKMRTD
ncbi:peptidase, T1 family [Trichinella nativa]|uniref:Peptidase, T1 family n=1 Tax=Trichinella nativa TaxID=6335 RepID=A0A1Y3E8Q9_9BILA|nr:peptidase, T1 family [Trichinella nativa]